MERDLGDLVEGRHFQGEMSLQLLPVDQERIRWEVFHGQLLDAAHTRQEKTFKSWNIHEIELGVLCPEPILSLKWDKEQGEVHVVRAVQCYGHEAYDSGAGVILTRECRKWVRERIATVSLERRDWREEIHQALGRAVTGTRLPLSGVEAPMPAFTFGRLWYRADERRRLEFELRSEPVEQVAEKWSEKSGPRIVGALKRTFLETSLSPYTDFVDRVLCFLACLERRGVLSCMEILRFEAWLLCLVCRHLTAYDLHTFHYRGANYPDALLLDAVLGDYLARMRQNPEVFAGEAGRPLRRAWRQAYVVRSHYEGHLVPDVPTSPGEHARVYPASWTRVSEEQIVQPSRRRKRLFDGDPLSSRLDFMCGLILQASIEDLRHAEEREELGVGVYLDRPFGGGKHAVEPDLTPLLASVAYSPSLARRRAGWLERERGGVPLSESSPEWGLPGVALKDIGGPVRQGTVSLADAARAASDFVFRETMPGSIRHLRSLFEFEVCGDLWEGVRLLARAVHGPGLIGYDEGWEAKLELEPLLQRGYSSRLGEEVPTAGLRVRRLPGEGRGEEREIARRE